MLYIPNSNNDPYFNLAVEEYILKNLDLQEPCLLLWQNEPTVVVGRFQNTREEINHEFIQQQQIHVVRRITGGGAVYHDLGNLNFTFIEKQRAKGLDFRKFTEPIVKALAAMGIPAEYSGRNDLTIKGKKFSGNSQYHYRGKTMHHGTLLFATNLEHVGKALSVQGEKLQSKGVKSVRSRVTNIKDNLAGAVTLQEFKGLLLKYLFQGQSVPEYLLTEQNLAQISNLRAEKYLTWAWNYGHSPAFNFKKKKRFPCGEIEVCLDIEVGMIKECKIYGDFFSSEDLVGLERKIIGLKYQEDVLAKLIKCEETEKYFGKICSEEVLALFFS